MMKAPSGQAHVVKKGTFTEEQIAFALKQAELDTRVKGVCCKMGISEAELVEGESSVVRQLFTLS